MKNENKIILDLCGGTGSWSKKYKDVGYDVKIITLPDYDIGRVGITHWLNNKDIREWRFQFWSDTGEKTIDIMARNVYGILAAPPCTEFSFAKTTGEPRSLFGGMREVENCLKIVWTCQYQTVTPHAKTTSLKFWALENPGGLLKRFLGKPVFKFNPYDFGENYKKSTYLWGWFNEPKKNPIKCTKPKFDKLLTREIAPEQYGKLTRQERRAITPAGFAKAFYEANK